MCKSLSGWGSQDTAYSEPEKQLYWRTLSRPEFCGITQVLQKCSASKPRVFFLKGRPIKWLKNVLPACLDCLSLPASTTCRKTPHHFPLPQNPLHLTICCGLGTFSAYSPCLTDQLALLQRLDSVGESPWDRQKPAHWGKPKLLWVNEIFI